MKNENRAFEFEALVAEGQVIAIEVQGMRFENEQRMALGQSMAYVEDSFLIKANEMRLIIDKLRGLKG
ncbi:MAG: hypothetical protein Q7J27_00515 [Syntrophales bacterium]|nr:hypothetical protein [Syntrophales bacterium]